jgi:hypothetical protein
LLALGLLFLLALLGAGSLYVLARSDERWERRIAAAPLVARSYLRRWRPTPVFPTPPPGSADTRARLLQAPTLAPTAAIPIAASPTTDRRPPPTFTPPATIAAATPTASVTATPAATSTPTATPYPLTPVAPTVNLAGVNHAAQMWNNCGPTTLAMYFSYYGLDMHQREPAAWLKPNPDDKNVSPEQLTAYAAAQGFATTIRVGGTLDILQQFISNGIPVIVEDWILPDDLGGMGHYRLLTGYDTAARYFIAQDSYFGPDKHVPMSELNNSWRVFNRKFLLIYRPEQQETVTAILGPLADDATMWAQTLATAQADAQAHPADPFAWFNVGAAYTHLGQPDLATAAFDEARRIGLPLRMFWYQFEIFDAYLASGRYDDVAQLAYATTYSASGHEEGYYYQGLAYAAQGKEDVAISNLRKAIEYNPNFTPAADALAALEN